MTNNTYEVKKEMIETINKDEIIPLTFDIMFAEIFNNEESICILEEFIAGYFNYPLDSVRGNLEILSRRLPKENRMDSRKEVDLLLNLNGRKINIEMSNSRSNGVVNRNIVYLCKIHGEQLKYGDDSYSKINESVQIVFNNYNCHDELKKTYYLRDDEMVRLYTKLSKRELEFNTLKEEAREEGWVKGRNEGLAEGFSEGHVNGLEEGTKNVALNMLKEGISILMVSKCTNLSEEEINKLK